ncbi:MAG TPA: hypothetical protein VMT52_00125 [Planctomycetota bacterium]|nr:hypothetical protein [Planctomycetota bacterium]
MVKVNLGRCILCACALSGAVASWNSSFAAEVFFDENFNSGGPNASLEGYSGFVLSDGSIHRNQQGPSDQERRYIRTLVRDYNERDFVLELTYVSGESTITYVGIGLGDGEGQAYSEPKLSMTFRIHSPDVVDGRIDVNTTQGGIEIGNVRSIGPNRVRIEKRGNRISFAIDAEFNGVFSADVEREFILSTAGSFLGDDGCHLFFGSARAGTLFDDLTIYPPLGAHLFLRGDANGDGLLNIGDPVDSLSYLFLGGTLTCLDASDVDDNGSIEISDAIGLLGYLFIGTLPPLPPFQACGQDPSDDRLSCDAFDACD